MIKGILKDETGSTLVEGMIALSLLAVVIVSMFTMITAIFLSRSASEENFYQGKTLISIQDEAAYRVKNDPNKSAEVVAANIVAVVTQYEGWSCQVRSAENDLYQVTYIYSGKRGERRYESQIYAGKVL